MTNPIQPKEEKEKMVEMTFMRCLECKQEAPILNREYILFHEKGCKQENVQEFRQPPNCLKHDFFQKDCAGCEEDLSGLSLKPINSPQESWREEFRQEFGIHFKNSSGELQFVEAFIEDALAQARKEGREEAEFELNELQKLTYENEARRKALKEVSDLLQRLKEK